MRSRLVVVGIVGLLLCGGCGAGGDRCPEVCKNVVELCGGSQAGCEAECRARFEGKTSGSIAQAAQCALEASSCDAAEACQSHLVDAPQGGGSDCPQCCDCQCKSATCTGNTKTLTPPSAGECFDCDAVCGTLCGQIQCGSPISAAECATGGGAGGTADAGTSGIGWPRDTGGGGGEDTTAFVDAYCGRMADCDLLSGADPAVCRQAAELIAVHLIAPDTVATCLAGKSCGELDADLTGAVEGCLDVDEASHACVDGTTFRYCNRGGQCRNVDCDDFCSSLLPSFSGRCDLSVGNSFIRCKCEM